MRFLVLLTTLAAFCTLATSQNLIVSTDPRVLEFVSWLENGGAVLDVVIQKKTAGFTAVASKPLQSGETFMEVPVNFALNERRALESSKVAPVLRELREMYGTDQDMPFDHVAALITALVFESFYAEDSFWSPYFAMLPHHFDGHPNYLTQDEAQRMQDLLPFMFSVLFNTKPRPDRMNERTVSWYLNRVFAPYPEYFGKSTKAQRDTWSEQLRWAMTIVTSRAFAPRFPGDGITLIPGIDILNHNTNGSIAHHTMAALDGQPAIVSYGHSATKPVKAGEEVFACYVKPPDDGACNDLMFLSWGFTISDSKYYCALLQMKWQPDPFKYYGSQQIQALKSIGLTQHAYDKRETIVLMDLRVHADAAELPPLALKILRVVAAPELELNEALADGLDFSEPLSLASERRALRSFGELVANMHQTALRENEVVKKWVQNLNAPTRLEQSTLDMSEGQVQGLANVIRIVDRMLDSL